LEKNDIPKPASGFSALILSRQSWLKNMYAESGRFGAFGSFLRPARWGFAFSDFSAALRVCEKEVRTCERLQEERIYRTDLGLGCFLRHLWV
jgi:hypothetical protein